MGVSIVPRIKLGLAGLQVSKQGLGCMGMSALYGPPKPEPEMIKLIHHAINSGVTFLDTSDAYGPHTNEILIGKALKGMREKMQIVSKFGITWAEDGKLEVRCEPAYARAACEASLKRLDIDCIDLYYVHRIDSRVPIELTMEELKKLVEEGKIKHVGLSEASVATVRRAHAVHPVTAVQNEWSLWSRSGTRISPYLQVRELGIGIVPYSPLGRGFLAAGPSMVRNLPRSDSRKRNPRFESGNLEANELVYEKVSEVAARKGCSPSQVALAWVQQQGDDVCPIPGTTKMKNFDENLGSLTVKLSAEEMNMLSSLSGMVKGERSSRMAWLDANTPPLPPLT